MCIRDSEDFEEWADASEEAAKQQEALIAGRGRSTRNVGIATTARSDYALYVQGNIFATGDLDITGEKDMVKSGCVGGSSNHSRSETYALIDDLLSEGYIDFDTKKLISHRNCNKNDRF